MIMAAFNAVLGLQVCHELSALAVDGLDQVTWAQGSLGRFAPSVNLWLEKKNDTAGTVTPRPSALGSHQPQNLASVAFCQRHL